MSKTRLGYKKVKWLFGKEIEIPEEWIRTRLYENCNEKAEYGASISAIEKNLKLPRYIRITDLNDNGSLRNSEWKSILEEDAKGYILNEDEILFARTGATVGKTYLYQKSDGVCAFAGYLIRFKPDNKKLDSNFLFHFTHSKLYRVWLLSIQTWGVQPNVNAEQYSSMPILLPSFKEQQKIASILSNVDALIENIQKVTEKAERLKKGLMQQLLTWGIGHTKFKKVKWLFGKEIEIPEEWKLIMLKQVSKIRQGLQIPISERFSKPNSNRLAYITVKSVHSNDFEEFIENASKRVICSEDDVLFTRTGNTGEIISGIKGVFHNNFFLIDFDKKSLLKEYLIYFLKQKKIQEIIKSLSGSTTIPDINHGDFYRLLITLPPLPEQQKIASILSGVDAYIQKNQEYKEKLEHLKKGLMQKLLTGQIRVKI